MPCLIYVYKKVNFVLIFTKTFQIYSMFIASKYIKQVISRIYKMCNQKQNKIQKYRLKL